MDTQRSPSRDSSVSRRSWSQRASLSRLSNPDVFSDDFALSSRGNSPVESLDGSYENLPAHASSQPPPTRLSTVSPPSHLNTTNFSRPSSSAKRPLTFGEGLSVVPRRAISSVSHSDAATPRSSSVSSHFSIPRAQSPYTGPIAPTQPYAMYPQVTRASSVASESTYRPVERPYIGTGGPEHPYGMYPQNTVDEEEAEDTHGPASTIPLGFPGMAQIYRDNQATGHDLGDIVGRDGHIEQLPPYTRYADNTIAKAGSEDILAPVAVDISSPSSTAPTDSDVEVNPTTNREVVQPEAEYNEKSKRPRRLRRKVCWGISLCVWLLVVGVIVIAATLGGVIGGVIGNDRAADAAADSAPTATTTVWLDAGPLPTNVPAPNCTPGAYNMPTSNISLNTPLCIANQEYASAWECLYDEPVPFWIRYKDHKPFISLGQDGPGNGQGFSYGAQKPDLNGSFYPLVPSIDKDDPSAGGAMFVALLYDKLTVVPSIVYGSSKRDVNIEGWEESLEHTPVLKTDKPYFCWFNQTLLELFIYSNLSTKAGAANSTAYAYPSSTTSSYSTFSDSVSTSMAAQSSSYNMNQLTPPAPTTPPPPPDTYTESSDGTWSFTSAYWPPSERLARRDDDDFPIYNKQVRLAEKRAPSGNGDDVTPYCVQVEIRDDWSICPIDGSEIQIQENEPAASGASRRRNRPRSMNNLDSDCACQWYST